MLEDMAEAELRDLIKDVRDMWAQHPETIDAGGRPEMTDGEVMAGLVAGRIRLGYDHVRSRPIRCERCEKGPPSHQIYVRGSIEFTILVCGQCLRDGDRKDNGFFGWRGGSYFTHDVGEWMRIEKSNRAHLAEIRAAIAEDDMLWRASQEAHADA